jgi:hypothetical protein
MASLDAFFEQDEDDPMVNSVQTLSEKIRQRRIQMLVHSYLYYEMDENVVDDHKWQQWADELVVLQKQKMDIGFYDDAFRDWTGASGAFLPFDDWVKERAKKLLQLKQINAI